MAIDHVIEEIKVMSHELADKVKSLIREGNVNRIIIKDEKGHTFVEIPVTVAAVGAVLAPVVAAVGAIAAMAARFTIVVEKTAPHAPLAHHADVNSRHRSGRGTFHRRLPEGAGKCCHHDHRAASERPAARLLAMNEPCPDWIQHRLYEKQRRCVYRWHVPDGPR